MKKIYLVITLAIFFCASLSAQFARHSVAKYQFNALSINPAFAGTLDYGNMDLIYFGNFSEFNSLYRSVQLSLQAPIWSSEHAHWGAVFGFEKEGIQTEINFRPAYSYSVDLDVGRISFGGMVGVSFFDFQQDQNLITDFKSFVSINGGLGIFLTADKYFAGISSLQVFEKGFLDENRILAQSFRRENPYYLFGGFNSVINDRFRLKPTLLLKYADYYFLPETGGPVNPENELAGDLNLTLIIQDNYHVNVFYGYSDYDNGESINRYGFGLHFLIDYLRLSYGFQQFVRGGSGTELPTSHFFSVGYRFVDEEG